MGFGANKGCRQSLGLERVRLAVLDRQETAFAATATLVVNEGAAVALPDLTCTSWNMASGDQEVPAGTRACRAFGCCSTHPCSDHRRRCGAWFPRG
jgi:hypothetical protein